MNTNFATIVLAITVMLPIGPASAQTEIPQDEVKRNLALVEKQRQAQEKEKYQKYLRNKDHADGISQKSGPVGGRSSDGKGGWIGYKWSTD